MFERSLARLTLSIAAGSLAAATAASCAAPANDTPQEKGLLVGTEMVECVGVAPQLCLQVKENPEDDWTLLYDPIEGFEHVVGYLYELLVEATAVDSPPAGASSLRLRLVEVVSKTPAD